MTIFCKSLEIIPRGISVLTITWPFFGLSEVDQITAFKYLKNYFRKILSTKERVII